jgi:hypothetical protein
MDILNRQVHLVVLIRKYSIAQDTVELARYTGFIIIRFEASEYQHPLADVPDNLLTDFNPCLTHAL